MVCILREENFNSPLEVFLNEDVSTLTVRLMTEKFNKRYGQQLNNEQQTLIKEYVFSTQHGETREFRGYLNELKASLHTELDLYANTCDNKILNEKMDKVQFAVSTLDTSAVDDETVSRFLLVSQLKSEIMEADDE